jgi:ribosomal protein S18 acetylase RimI-like enzyme
VETILKDTSKAALITAIEANIFALFGLFKHWPQAGLHDTPELLRTITDVPFPLFNSVLRPRLLSGTIDKVIDSTLADYQSRNVPMMWWTGPSTQPPDLGRILSERGLHESVSPGMAVDLTSLPENYPLPKDLLIKKVEKEEELDIWSRVLTGVFGMPDFVTEGFYDFFLNLGFDFPMLNYIGSIDDEVVATSSVLLGAGVAGIYNVATLESARRRGIGAAMTAVPLLQARSAGYRVSTLESSESGFNVYRKLGFQEYCKLYRHIWMEEQ